ncbi:hypothetical protein A6U85_03760 [Agrobacterium sp. 13-626]|nr:hypothetical protein A6U85_03760 [Agrobacterium sp. 13-626]
MTNVHHLTEQRNTKIEAIKALGSNPDQGAFNALETEIRGLTGQIDNARKVAEFERQAATATPDANASRELRSYSVAKAIREAQDGTLTGIEREQHDQLSKGREVRGVMIPTAVIFGEQRAMTVGGSGGNTVETSLGGLIDRLRPVLAVQKLGATIIPGLTGNLDLPRLVSGPSTTWVAEDGSSTASDSVFDKVPLKPKTITAEQYLSRRLLLQNGVALENVLRNDLAFVLAQGLDKAAIAGTGTNQPTGLLTAIVESGTASTVLSDIAADLLADIELDDVTGTIGFLTNPALLAAARKVKDTTERTIPQAEIFHDTPVVSTTQVAAIAGENPLIAGVWSELMIGYFSGVDILANPYTDASKGGLRLHAFLDADIALRHTQAFAWKAV